MLRAVAAQDAEWALNVLFAAPAFDLVLLNRSSDDYSKMTKDARFAVVEAVVANPRLAMLGELRVEALRLFQRQGPYMQAAKTADVQLGQM